VVGGFPIVLTNKPDDARAKIAENLTIYGQLPSYRAMLDREGVKGPADIAIAGDENALRGQLKRLEDMGVTHFNAAIAAVEEGAYERTLEFLAAHGGRGASPMCGNSICQDRRFLARRMPELERYFHYRNLDVSSLKELARRWAPTVLAGFTKKSTHLALEDIRDSVAELRYYRETFIAEAWRGQ